MKGIPYRTVWVDCTDIEALCKKLGVSPTTTRPSGDPCYTLPTIYDPNTKRAVTDSAAIVRYLESAYPAAGPTLAFGVGYGEHGDGRVERGLGMLCAYPEDVTGLMMNHEVVDAMLFSELESLARVDREVRVF